MGGKRSKVSICFECDHKFEQYDNCFCAFAMRPPSASVFIPKMYLVVCSISRKPQSRKTVPGRALVESSQPGWHSLQSILLRVSVWSLIAVLTYQDCSAGKVLHLVSIKTIAKEQILWTHYSQWPWWPLFFSPLSLLPVHKISFCVCRHLGLFYIVPEKCRTCWFFIKTDGKG